MKTLLIVLALVSSLFAAGGDTVKLTSRFKNIADDDTIFSWWWNDPIDSIVKTVNGRLGNINFSSTANLSFAKMDTTGNCRARRGKFDTLFADSIKALRSFYSDTIKSYKFYTTLFNADSLAVRALSGLNNTSIQIYDPQINSGWLEGEFNTTAGVDINLTDSTGNDNIPHYMYPSTFKVDTATVRAQRSRRIQVDSIYFHHDSTDTSYRPNGATIRDSLKYVLIDSLRTKRIVADSITYQKDSTDTAYRKPIAINAQGLVFTSGSFIMGYPDSEFTVRKYDTVYFKKWTWPDTTIELSFNKLIGNAGGTDSIHFVSDSLIPLSLRPSDTIHYVVSIIEDAPYYLGMVHITPNGKLQFSTLHDLGDLYFEFYHNFFAALKCPKGHYRFMVRYRK